MAYHQNILLEKHIQFLLRLYEKLEEETNNNNTCGRRHSQHHNAHLS